MIRQYSLNYFQTGSILITHDTNCDVFGHLIDRSHIHVQGGRIPCAISFSISDCVSSSLGAQEVPNYSGKENEACCIVIKETEKQHGFDD